jgi:hypothetical protein
MIDRYTIKFAPAVGQKELEGALNESGETPGQNPQDIHKMKARIELIGGFENVKRISALLKELSPLY